MGRRRLLVFSWECRLHRHSTAMLQILVSRKQSKNSCKQRQMHFLMDALKLSDDPTQISRLHCITPSDMDGWISSEP